MRRHDQRSKFWVRSSKNLELRTSNSSVSRASRLRSGRDEMLLGETDQLLKSRGILDGHVR